MSIKIKGPTSGPPPVEPSSTAPAATGARGASEAGAVRGPSADVVARVAGGLRAGSLTPEAAVELLIKDTVRRHAGSSDAGAKLAAELRQVLRDTADSDPFLAGKIRRLTTAK